jgi:hypothetical protein
LHVSNLIVSCFFYARFKNSWFGLILFFFFLQLQKNKKKKKKKITFFLWMKMKEEERKITGRISYQIEIWFLHNTTTSSVQHPLTWEWTPHIGSHPMWEGVVHLLWCCCKSIIFPFVKLAGFISCNIYAKCDHFSASLSYF